MDPDWLHHLPRGRSFSPDLLTAAGSLPAAWTARWTQNPTRAVLHDGRWWSGEELEERSRRVAGRFAAAGLVPGDRIVMSAAPSAELVVAHLAALRLGLVVVPVNVAYRERELAHVAIDAAPAIAIVDDGARGTALATAAPGLLVVGPDVALADGPDPVLDAVAGADVAMLCYTSGTTGVPKGAMLTHTNLLASVNALRIAWRWEADDRLVLALPLFHVHGLAVGLHGSLAAGGSVVLRPGFDVDDVLDRATEHAATLFFGVPTMYQRFAASGRAHDLSWLRLCVSGSAPLPASLCATFARGFGVRVLERYGMTETLMNVSNPYEGERRPGTVGFALPGTELRLAGADREEGGEILVRGPNVFAGYRDRPDATAEAFDADGWFHTGDVGVRDGDGYLSIVGRTKELIISGGLNVYPREVEDVLRTHPGVADVAVAGRPSDEWGEAVTAFVVLADAGDGSQVRVELTELAGTELASFKRPRTVVFVDELPRNALGKILRDQL